MATLSLRKVLAKAYCLEILVALKENQRLNFGKIVTIAKYPSTATARLRELIELGIVEREVAQDAQRTVEYYLTKRGKEIAGIASKILNLE